MCHDIKKTLEAVRWQGLLWGRFGISSVLVEKMRALTAVDRVLALVFSASDYEGEKIHKMSRYLQIDVSKQLSLIIHEKIHIHMCSVQ